VYRFVADVLVYPLSRFLYWTIRCIR